MATAKKLPSGNWRVQVFSHVDASGKRVYESFTAQSKREAEMDAAIFAAKKKRRAHSDLNVAEAIDAYITARQGVLSPSTIREYRRMEKKYFHDIAHYRIKKLSSNDMQAFVSSLAREISPKTVKCVYGLLAAAVTTADPDAHFKVKLPQAEKKRPVAPSDEEVAALFQSASPKLKKAIALASYGIRRGEICAIRYRDIEGQVIHITSDIVMDENKKWVRKNLPKTADSVRDVIVAQAVIDLLGTGKPDDSVTGYTPNAITQAFTKERNALGLSIRFHDLRHYFASVGAVLNIPDTYMEDMGGWRRGSNVMKHVYQNKIIPMSEVYAKRMSDHLENVLIG